MLAIVFAAHGALVRAYLYFKGPNQQTVTRRRSTFREVGRK